MTTYSLFDLNEFIRRILALNFQESVWVRAEIGEMNMNRGHCYLELIEKSTETNEIVAKTTAVLWKNDWQDIRREKGIDLDEILQIGAEIRVRVWIDFHEQYGLKFLIKEVDAAFTLGQIELNRRQTIRTLSDLNLLQKNARLPLPKVLQRIAVVTSETAAGFQDFSEHLAANPFGFQFQCSLFSIAVQGRFVENDFLQTIEKIKASIDNFDCIVIIRGGGSRLDLAAFDSLEICKAAADLPIPFFTGIGHDVDETALDLVAFSAQKTPTAVADFLINHNLFFESEINQLVSQITGFANTKLNAEANLLENTEQFIFWKSAQLVKQANLRIDQLNEALPNFIEFLLKSNREKLNQTEQLVQAFDPKNILKRGFSLTTKNGKVIRQSSELNSGDILKTQFADGEIQSKAFLT